MAIGILGILKAGGAYVPLDPGYPPERLAFMLKDVQTPVLLTQKHLVEKLPLVETSAICLDADWQARARQSEENLTVAVTAENLAYVIYTSGSTGKPKGVQISHAAVVNFLTSMRQQLAIADRDIWLAVTSLSFDIAALELFLPITTGSRVVVASRKVASDGQKLLETLNNSGATIMQATPASWKMLLAAGWPGSEGLKILCGGEALPQQLANQLQLRGAFVWNLYGPTETTIWSTLYQLDRKDESVSIGRPIANTQIYILDRYLMPVPVGVFGELHIGGAGLARGYLNRPELTAQKFIPNPFSNSPDARLYKTGDLARYLPDGNIEYLGRIDNQVKIRGYRIELGEIEETLRQHPAVRDAATIARDDGSGNKRLIAYIVAPSETTLTTGELHVFLKEKLPDYMVPAAFVLLEALPLTINGKVDRRSLPEPDTARPDLAFDFVAPGTAEEKALAEIWEKILGVEKVGIRDNFFALGGDSIRSIQVQSLAQKQGLRFSLQQLFQSPTIEAIVRELKATEFKELEPSKSQAFSLILPADKQQIPDNVEDAYPLTALQMGMIFHSEYSQESAIYHDIFSFHLKAPLEIQVLQAAIEYLVKRHAVLRTSFQLTGFSEPLQLVHQKVKFPCRWKICATSPIPSEKRL
jgi:amino acid adenylation domain-containing protein